MLCFVVCVEYFRQAPHSNWQIISLNFLSVNSSGIMSQGVVSGQDAPDPKNLQAELMLVAGFFGTIETR